MICLSTAEARLQHEEVEEAASNIEHVIFFTFQITLVASRKDLVERTMLCERAEAQIEEQRKAPKIRTRQ